LATSSWRFTPETLWLVQELDRPRLNGLYIGTLVLDYEDGIPRETSLAKLHQSEAVIFEIPRPTEPDYLNIYSDAYLAAAEAGGTALAEGVPDAFKIFILRPR
jgi:hypothetical protein